MTGGVVFAREVAGEESASAVNGEGFTAGDGLGVATAAERELIPGDSATAGRVVAGVSEFFAASRAVVVFWFVSRAWLVKSARVPG